MENALRSASCGWIALNRITVEQLFPGAYWPNIRNPNGRIALDPASVVSREVILALSLQQLARTVFLNWELIPSRRGHVQAVEGFYMLFTDDPRCRDRNRFMSDMSAIRHVRNDVAHSLRLFAPEEVRQLYIRVCFWLTPLSIELMHKVSAYRRNRPRFLHDLDAASWK